METQTESGTGIRKRIDIRLVIESPSVSLTYTLTNDSDWAVELIVNPGVKDN